MTEKFHIYVVSNIKLPINASCEEAFSVSKRRLDKIGITPNTDSFRIYKRSIDARNKEDIKFVYSVSVLSNSKIPPESKMTEQGVSVLKVQGSLSFKQGTIPLKARPLIVGSGPAGLFAALYLAEVGFRPVIIERGGSVSDRTAAVKRFSEERILDPETNIQFGAGGAGTFSDGKLVTRINDPLSSYVLSRFTEFGAPSEIQYLAKPHIGTDVLAPVIENVLKKIVSLGGEVHYNTKYEKSIERAGVSVALTDKGEIAYGVLILAIGHSARDTYFELINSGYAVEPKQFSVGMRIEHLAEDIDKSMFGKFAGNNVLGHAEYNLSHNTKERGVYTFCMCPGGEVVAATNECCGVVVNGMSRHARSGVNSNSAVVCSVFKEDYGNSPIKAIEFQKKIESAAFISAGKDYSAPLVTVGDFIDGKAASLPKRILPTYMNGNGYAVVSPEKYLPNFVVSGIKNALLSFDKKIKGFAVSDAVLTGPETRTSAPIRILRNNETGLALGKTNIYPVGEGAGYAGGITSAAIDGLKTAIKIVKEYKPTNG